MVDKVLSNLEDEKLIGDIRGSVKTFMEQFPLYPELK
jgi:glycine hydroxymethyltransferase